MTSLDAQKAEKLQREGKRIAPDIRASYQRNLMAIERIEELFGECGLDPMADESYELARAGLTRGAFLGAKTICLAYQVLDTYHSAQRMTHDGGAINVQVGTHYYQLERLLDYALPEFEKAAAQVPLPKGGLSPLEATELSFIRQMAADGTLAQELSHAANALAEDNLRSAFMYAKAMKGNNLHEDAMHARRGVAHARMALELIDKAGADFVPRDIPDGYGHFGGWSETNMRYDRQTAQDFQKLFTLKQCASEFAQAKKFHDQGHYVLDASGSGHGMMVMPMQDILRRLEDNGFDIRDPKTFTGMGTDIDTVWACYRTERQHTMAGPSYAKLAGPELKR